MERRGRSWETSERKDELGDWMDEGREKVKAGFVSGLSNQAGELDQGEE